MAFDPKSKNQTQHQSNPKPDKSHNNKEDSKSGGPGGMIGEGRADDGSKGGMKGER